MASTPTTDRSTRTRRAADKSSLDYLQDAISDLDRARERAGVEAREAIDAARERVREAVKDASGSAQDEVSEWRQALDRAGENLRRELGLMAVRAQDSTETLSAMSSEIRKRRAELSE